MMFPYFLRINLISFEIKNSINSRTKSFYPQLQFLQIPSPSSSVISRYITTISNPDQFTINYLINSCGLSPGSALKTSNKIAIKSTTGPDSVLSLFKNYGFTQPHISKLISTIPRLLLANPNKMLQFFTTIGISGPDLGNLISKNTCIFQRNLEKQIIPSISFLKTIVPTDSDIIGILNCSKWSTLLNDAENIMGPKIKMLEDHGVPTSNISKFIAMKPQCLYMFYQKEIFEKGILRLEKLGFSPCKMKFLRGLYVLLTTKKPLWETKLAVYGSFGWSEDEVLFLFQKNTDAMAAPAKKINLALDFFMNNLKWTRADIVRNYSVFLLNLEKNLKPRYCVLQILLSKGLISKDVIGQALKETKEKFPEKYVIKYHLDVPDLLKLYRSKMKKKQKKRFWRSMKKKQKKNF